MKKLLSIILICSLLICSCGTEIETTNSSTQQIVSEEPVDETEELISDSFEVEKTLEEVPISEDLDIEIKGLDDENLLRYVEDSVYSGLVKQLDSEEYYVGNVEAVYYPKEYIEALSANSQSNKYFGFTTAELNEQFQGIKYVFTIGENGQTIVVPMETLSDDVYVEAMQNVLVGTGVILVCVTVALVAAPVAPAVEVIFAASGSTGTTFALQTGTLSFAAETIVKGYETEDFKQALKTGVKGASEGYKWGAITGAIVGGAEKTIALKGATKNGLTMNQAAKIQKETKYPLDVIKQFKSVEEADIYFKEAGLYPKMVNGRLAMVRNVDLEYVSELSNGEKVSNLVRMLKGYAPIDPATGKPYQLHHINQDPNGTLAILTEKEHQGNAAILNTIGKESEIDRAVFDKIRKEFWKKYAESLL